MPKPKMTAAQQRVLCDLSDEEYRFARGSEERVCAKLESLGMVHGRLQVSGRDDYRGLTNYRRAYRRLRVDELNRCGCGKPCDATGYCDDCFGG